MTDIAIAHKDYDVRGGGEILAEELARTFTAPLYVGKRGPDCEPDDPQLAIRQVNRSAIGDTLIERGGPWRALAYMHRWRFESEALHDFETVILSGNEPLWYIPPTEQTVVAYTHSPPRWLYDLFPQSVAATDGPRGLLGRYFEEFQRQLYEDNIRRPDLFVANSDVVARRIERYWNVPAEQIRVVYPPVPVDEFGPEHARDDADDYYFTVSRLDGAKRIDEIIAAANRLDAPLVVAGDGPERDRLTALAGDSVRLLGWIPEAEKRRRLAEARALIFNARNEDFGIVPIEAMASGTPVIGVAEGFTQYQVRDGKNGLTYERGRLEYALRQFRRDGVAWDGDRIARFADQFGVDRFRTGMRDAVAVAQARSAVESSLSEPGRAAPDRERAVADGGDPE